jgi:predicted enzyme related to lactoylglutathione lyase
MDMGDMGVYQTFGPSGAEDAIGGMMRRPPHVPVSHWLHYATVANADESAKRIADHGGKVLMGPMDVPGGGRIVMAMDPQGAAFAVFAPGAM